MLYFLLSICLSTDGVLYCLTIYRRWLGSQGHSKPRSFRTLPEVGVSCAVPSGSVSAGEVLGDALATMCTPKGSQILSKRRRVLPGRSVWVGRPRGLGTLSASLESHTMSGGIESSESASRFLEDISQRKSLDMTSRQMLCLFFCHFPETDISDFY